MPRNYNLKETYSTAQLNLKNSIDCVVPSPAGHNVTHRVSCATVPKLFASQNKAVAIIPSRCFNLSTATPVTAMIASIRLRAIARTVTGKWNSRSPLYLQPHEMSELSTCRSFPHSLKTAHIPLKFHRYSFIISLVSMPSSHCFFIKRHYTWIQSHPWTTSSPRRTHILLTTLTLQVPTITAIYSFQ